MTISKYKQTLDDLRERYMSVFQQWRQTEGDLRNLAKSIEGLAALCGEEPNIIRPGEIFDVGVSSAMAELWLKAMPFADAVRTALRIVAPVGFTPSELRGFLARAGYPINAKTDPMVSLNVALKRLHDSEEVETIEKEGRKVYRWAHKNELAPLPDDKPKVDWESFLRTASHFGHVIAELDPEAATRAFMEPELSSDEEREISLYLRNSHTTIALTVDQLYKAFSENHHVRSARKTREFIQTFLTGPTSPYKEVRTKGKDLAYVQKR